MIAVQEPPTRRRVTDTAFDLERVDDRPHLIPGFDQDGEDDTAEVPPADEPPEPTQALPRPPGTDETQVLPPGEARRRPGRAAVRAAASAEHEDEAGTGDPGAGLVRWPDGAPGRSRGQRATGRSRASRHTASRRTSTQSFRVQSISPGRGLPAVLEGGVADPLAVGGQQDRGQRAGVGGEAVPHAGGVLVHGRPQAGRGRRGREAMSADGNRQLVEGSMGGAQGSASGSAAEQAIHKKER